MKQAGWIVAVAAGLAAVAVQAQQEDGWSFRLTPYAWAMGVEGDVGAAGLIAPVDIDFLEAAEDLDMAGMLAVEAAKGPWSLVFDGSYLKVSDDPQTRTGTINIELEQWILQGAVLYRAGRSEKTTVDVGVGGRYLEQDLDLTGLALKADSTKGWGDPLFVARIRQQFGAKCFGVVAGDIGGFDAASKLTWQVTAAAGYDVSENVALLLAYRYLDYDYEEDGFVYDAASSGVALGLQFRL